MSSVDESLNIIMPKARLLLTLLTGLKEFDPSHKTCPFDQQDAVDIRALINSLECFIAHMDIKYGG